MIPLARIKPWYVHPSEFMKSPPVCKKQDGGRQVERRLEKSFCRTLCFFRFNVNKMANQGESETLTLMDKYLFIAIPKNLSLLTTCPDSLVSFKKQANDNPNSFYLNRTYFKTSTQAQSQRWNEVVNPRNWGPALKEWGLSVAKK